MRFNNFLHKNIKDCATLPADCQTWDNSFIEHQSASQYMYYLNLYNFAVFKLLNNGWYSQDIPYITQINFSCHVVITIFVRIKINIENNITILHFY